MSTKSLWKRFTFAVGKWLYNEKYDLDQDMVALFETRDYPEALLRYQVLKNRHGDIVDTQLKNVTLRATHIEPIRATFLTNYVAYLCELNKKLDHPVGIDTDDVQSVPLTIWFDIHDAIQKAHTTQMLHHSKNVPISIPVTHAFNNLKPIRHLVKFYPNIFNNRPSKSRWIWLPLTLLGPLAISLYTFWLKSGKTLTDAELIAIGRRPILAGIALLITTACLLLGYITTESPLFVYLSAYSAFATVLAPFLLCKGLFIDYNEELAYLDNNTISWTSATLGDTPFAQIFRARLMAFANQFGNESRLVDINMEQYTPQVFLNRLANLIEVAPIIKSDSVRVRQNIRDLTSAFSEYQYKELTPPDEAYLNNVIQAFVDQEHTTP